MGSLDIITTGIVWMWACAALVAGIAIATSAIEFLLEQRQIRLASRQSFAHFYFGGGHRHAFGH